MRYWTCTSGTRMDGTCGVRHADQAEAQRHVTELDEANRQAVNARRRALGAAALGYSVLYTGRAVILQTE
jgi:hypothetical protein